MNIVKMSRLSIILVVMFATGFATVVAQKIPDKKILKESKSVSLRPESAHRIAYARNGIVPDRDGKGEVIGGALFVKIREGYGGMFPAATVEVLAGKVGLEVVAVSTLAGLETPLARVVQEKRASLTAERQARIARAEAELGRIIELSYAGDIHPRQAALLFQGLPEVEYAEPMSIPQPLSPQNPDDPGIDTLRQLRFVDAFEAWKIWPGDSTVTIGIVDAGINMYHEDLWPNIAPNPGEEGLDGEGKDKATNGIDDDGNGVIDDWKGANLSFYLDDTEHGNTVGSEHGTQVAGYAAARADNGLGIAGLGNQCRFFPVKTASAKGLGGLVEGYNGVLYCARRGFQVVNCSWGKPEYSQTEQDIIENIVLAYDVAIVAGAGNNFKHEILYPAGFRYVMGVGGVNEQGLNVKSWGEHVDITATSGTTTSGTSNYFLLEPATSYTTPVVAGIVALVRSRWPELDARQALAHTRLTAANIDALNAGKEKLVGFGKADAYEAVATNPFSHPGLLIDSVWVTDMDGNPRQYFGLGEKGRFGFRVVNVLGDLADGAAHIARYAEDSASIKFDETPVQIGSLASGESWVVPEGIPFEVISPGKGLTRLRIAFTGKDYEDYAYELLNLYRPYSVYSTPRMNLSFTESGHIGFDYRDFGTIGEGLTFDTRSLLYEGGLIVASDRTHVLDNVRNDDPVNFIQNADFTTVEIPSAANDYTLVLNDSQVDSAERIGVELRMQIQTVDTIANAVGIRIVARNTGDETLDSLRVGLFLDWDIDGFAEGQTVRYVPDVPVQGIAMHAIAANPLGSHVAAGIAEPADATALFAIIYNAEPLSLKDGFEKGEKWRTLSNGIGNPESGPGDISMVIGEVLADIPSGGEDTAMIVLGFSADDEAEATEGMRRFVARRLSSIVAVEGTSQEGLFVKPNPAMGRLDVRIPRGAHGTGATLRLRSVDGREVLNLSHQLVESGSETEFVLDVTDVPSGMYYLQYESEEWSALRSVIVVK